VTISYPGWRTSAQLGVSQNSFTSTIPSRSPRDLNSVAMPARTPSYPDPTVQEFDSGRQQASSRRNMVTGLERSVLTRSRDAMWDWTIFVNPFPDPITMPAEVRTCCSDSQTKLGFSNFADTTPPSNDQASDP